MTTMTTSTVERVAQLLYREARLLDASRYDDWLEMWSADDLEYWIPCNEEDASAETHIAIAYLDRKALVGRLSRLRSGHAYAQLPQSRMSRIVSNIEVEETEGSSDELTVHAKFNLTELRRHEQHTFSGRYEYTIDTSGDSWLIKKKKTVLVNLDEPIANLSFFL
jgi:benzoate/toluate 1,2-dioxygenase beta subunit